MKGRDAGIGAGLVLGLLLLAGCRQREELPRVRLWALAPPEVTQAGGEGPAPVRLAIAPTISPRQAYQLYGDLGEVLGQKMGLPVRLILRRTFAEVNDLIRTRQADLAHLCGRGFLQGAMDFGLTALAVPQVKGGQAHPGYIIVSAESEIASPRVLEGRTFAFADPPCAPDPPLRKGGGQPPDAFFRRKLTIMSHDRAVRAVAEGLAEGALVDGLVYARLAVADPALVAKTRVIEATAPYLNPPFAAHPAIDPALKEALRRALLSLHEEQAGRTVLARLGIERLVTPPREAGQGSR